VTPISVTVKPKELCKDYSQTNWTLARLLIFLNREKEYRILRSQIKMVKAYGIFGKILWRERETYS
jgi:hypothetical protein